jgi:hypothetical protein
MYFLRAIATIGIVAAALVLLRVRRTRTSAALGALTAAFALFAGFELVDYLRLAFSQLQHPPLWDFRAFWMFGLVAASHHNVYDPASYQVYRPLLNPGADPDFNAIAINIGMPYPPPAVLLVYPLGLIAKMSSAMLVWYVAIFSAIAAGIALLWRGFFAAEGLAGLAVVAILLFSLSASRMTVALAQVTFFVLVLLLLFWRERTPWRAGMWLAALIALRPLFVLFAIYFAVRRQWSALASLAATTVALVGISIPLLGPNGLASYVLHNPTQRYPGSYFFGSQCLYKLLATMNAQHEGYFSLTAHPLYVAIALVCLAGGAVVCALCAERQRDACLALLMLLGLWLYPSTDTHYCVVLLVPMGVVWRCQRQLGLSAAVVLGYFVAQYLLLDVRDGASTTGLLIALDSVFFAVIAFRKPSPVLERPQVAFVPFAPATPRASR